MDMTRLDWLWTSSWQASVLAGVVLVLQVSLGRRWNARWRLALWWVVVAKLLVPVTLPMPVSIYPKWIGWETGSRVLPEAAIDKPDRGWEAGISVPRVSLGETPSSETGFGGSVAARSKGEGRLPERDRVTESFATAIPRTGIHLPRQWLMGIWGVGCLALLMWQMIQALVLSRRIRAEASPAEPRWLRLVEWCRNELGIRRPVRLCVVPWLRGPAVFGWRQPVVLLPASMAGDLDERSMRHMVLHELAHVRRGDLGTNVVLVVLQAVHWFNPVLWLVFRRMREDRELAADELAMTHLAPGEASLYGMTLIQAVEMGSRLRPSSVALGMVGGKACLRRLRSWNGLGPGIVATSADGDFELPAALPSARVVAVHPHLGFAEMDYGVLERTRVIQLQPWGRIEGTLTSGSKVVPEANVFLLRRRAMGAEGMELSSHQAVTGPDGRFRLDTVPPGSLVLGRDLPVGDGREGRTFSPVGEVEVSPGETARVELGRGGRTIVGRVIANPEGRMLAGYSGFHGLYRKMPPPLGPMATRADYEARARTVRALADTGFPTVFSAVWEGNQGRFVVEDVPPGTYDLRFGFTTDWLSSYPRRLPRILGTLSREVVVPAASEGHGDGPLDVGLLQVSFDTAEDDEW